MISSQQPTILVIDDDDAIRQTLVDILELNDFSVISAANGPAGLDLARRDLPALVITDIEMPGLTGYELIQEFRRDERLRATPVIVISAKVDRAATRRGMELGADDFITKPFTEEEVIHSIRTRLDKKELLDELDAFAHTVAHDLKNPLSTLNGRLGLIELTIGQADEAALRRHVESALQATARLTAIIDEILVLAGVRQQRVTPEPLDMGAIVTEAMERIDELLRSSGATVAKPAAWPAAAGFAPWVAHVWSNYLSNAAKYGGPKAAITLGADVQAESGRVRFWVQDRGPGLDAAAQSALFVPFTRISTVRANGHGLGLSIVRRIVEKLGGQVGVESQPGQGARFWFELPAAPR
ncbi:MAG: hybrid sensor histidine kinase/response regulator [Verrucomicrobia bacterium]|nr:hybrid sensor histidine kinase/response regulator [Verrucomicrobiota bacterium]